MRLGATMFSERLITIFDLMASKESHEGERGILCSVAAEITAVSATGITLVTSMQLPLAFCASDEVAKGLIDLEITVGEGPCRDTLDRDDPVCEEDLALLRNSQWMLYAPSALARGVRAVFAFPLRIGAIQLGALCLYSTTPGPLSESQFTDALLMASVIGRGIVALQAGAAPAALSQELQREAAFDFSVHQAAGMLAVQASIDISSALVALRMHAFSVSQSLSVVSGRVIDRQLRFDPDINEWREGGL